MLSTLSKFRILARMVYPQFIAFEEWVANPLRPQCMFALDDDIVRVWYLGDGRYDLEVNGIGLAPLNLKNPQTRAIHVFWQAERFAKGDESIFAPKRREPGVVE